MKIKYFLITGLLLTLIFSNFSITISSICKNQEYSNDGYILYTPWLDKSTYLINTNGEIVNKWKMGHIRGFPVYLLENGNLLRADSAGMPIPFKFFFTGGCTGRVVMFNWEGEKIWTFRYVNLKHCLHNDIEPMPNGNILMLVWDLKTKKEAEDAGIRPEGVGSGGVMFDKIIEVEPTYPRGGKIVWEWDLWDHLIQDYNPEKENYGDVSEHPELIDINSKGKTIVVSKSTPFNRKKGDFSHFNAIDYNEKLDQIMVSSRYLNEIYIIDHSTTTEEAAGHSGGKYGKGGDILYRWGNPINYHAGNKSDQKIFAQHDSQWIKQGLPGEGNILIFDNGFGRPGEDYSSILELELPDDYNNGTYYKEPSKAYEPEEPVWYYTAENPTDFFSEMMSGVQRLPDGNTLICSSTESKFFIVNSEKEIIWEYNNRYPIPNSFLNYVYKTQYYTLDYINPDCD